jgi:hypothetical protein
MQAAAAAIADILQNLQQGLAGRSGLRRIFKGLYNVRARLSLA